MPTDALAVLLRVHELPGGVEAVRWRLLCFLLLCRYTLPVQANGGDVQCRNSYELRRPLWRC